MKGLKCSSSGSSVLSFNWTPPSLNADNVVGYIVEVTQYVQPEPAVKQVITIPLTSPFYEDVPAASLMAVVDSGVGECTIQLKMYSCDLFNVAAMGIPYNVSVRPRNSAGCGLVTNIVCFTAEGGM